MNNNLKNHWENIYQNKNEDEVSWFQKTPDTSIDIINSIKITKQSKMMKMNKQMYPKHVLGHNSTKKNRILTKTRIFRS